MVDNGNQMNYSSIENVEINKTLVASPSFRQIFDGNWTFYFVLGLISSGFFFAPFQFNTPLFNAWKRQNFGPLMWIHFIGSCIISFVCLWNLFHTPSHGPRYKVVHRWLGRIGLIASVFGATFGLLTTWFERFDSYGSSIGLSVLGLYQLFFTYLSYKTIRGAIKKRDLNGKFPTEEQQQEVNDLIDNHKKAVIGLWMCCLAPAWFRVPQLFGASADSPLQFIALVVVQPFYFAFYYATKRGSFW